MHARCVSFFILFGIVLPEIDICLKSQQNEQNGTQRKTQTETLDFKWLIFWARAQSLNKDTFTQFHAIVTNGEKYEY